MQTKGIVSFIIMLIFTGISSFAQQEPHVTQSNMNYPALNPAFYGTSNGINVSGLVRHQYLGFNSAKLQPKQNTSSPNSFSSRNANPIGNPNNTSNTRMNPETFFITADLPIPILHGGVGISLMQDKLGHTQNIGVKLGYAFHTTFRNGDLSIGFNMGFFNQRIDFAGFKPIDETDPVLLNIENKDGVMMYNFSLGALYNVDSRYYIGLSTSQILEFSYDEIRYTPKRHYYVMSGIHAYSDNNIQVIPTLMVQYGGFIPQCHINTNVIIKESYWVGIGYRLQDAVTVNAGLIWKDFKFGYAYDLNTSRITRGGSMGSHELILNYCFKLEREKNNFNYRNARYL